MLGQCLLNEWVQRKNAFLILAIEGGLMLANWPLRGDCASKLYKGNHISTHIALRIMVNLGHPGGSVG